MPELPEVETIRRQLIKHLPFKVEKYKTTAGLFQNILKTKIDIKNKTITDILRAGKILEFIFSDGSKMLSHLGMTGTWLAGRGVKLTKHSHLVLESGDLVLAYDDPRRFGKMYFYVAGVVENKISELGFDLLDSRIDEKYLDLVFKKFPEKKLKILLLDQKYFAGSGNYIANEICARAGIRPMRKCKDIKKVELQKIIKAIHCVIHPALLAGGTTFQGGYRDSTGEKGLGKSNLVVFYQKICQMCKKTKVKKIILAQRGTYYCPHCQK